MKQAHRPKAGKVALVTGAARGLGLAYTRRLAAEGAIVVAVDRDEAPGLGEILTGCGAPQADVHCADVSDPAQIDRLGHAALNSHGRCDIIVNNAGVSPRVAFQDITLELWRQTMAINVESASLICQGLVPSMIERLYGRIVNVSPDTFGLFITGFSQYTATKAAIIGLTRGLANNAGEHGITVNCIALGLTRTPNTEREFPDGAAFAQFAQSHAIKRPGTPENLVGAMSFLTYVDASFITGQTLLVNGGLLKGI